MAKTVIGVFDDVSDARDVVRELADAGFDRGDISIMARRGEDEGVATREQADDEMSGAATGAGVGAVIGGVGGLLVGLGAFAIPGVGPIVGAGWLVATLVGAAGGAVAGGLIGALTDAGVPEEHAHYYAESVRRGSTLVAVNARDEMANRAAAIMRSHGAVDIDQRGAEFRAAGFNRFDERSKPYTNAELTRERKRFASGKGKEVRVPVAEEKLNVGKREEQGGVRVYTRVKERPVEETVRLRDEHVEVERHKADRAVGPRDRDVFKEGSVVIPETREEPVVQKEARIVEEVVVSKEAGERTEKVRDKVRRTEVDVEPVGKGRSAGAPGLYARDENDYTTLPRDLRRLENLDDYELADDEPDPRGWDFIGRDGETVGTIKNLLASPSKKKAYFAVVDAGGWLNNKLFAVPLANVRFDSDDEKAFGPYAKEQFKNAPEYTEREPEYQRHYGYWRGAGPQGRYATRGM